MSHNLGEPGIHKGLFLLALQHCFSISSQERKKEYHECWNILAPSIARVPSSIVRDCVGAERCAEEFGRFGTEECVLIGIFIHVS